jgi:glucose-6-phosphate 1-dehydrogenase
MIGDAMLFQRAENIEAGWQAVQPILDAWANNSPDDFPNYRPGSNGPPAADELMARDGRAWRPLELPHEAPISKRITEMHGGKIWVESGNSL